MCACGHERGNLPVAAAKSMHVSLIVAAHKEPPPKLPLNNKEYIANVCVLAVCGYVVGRSRRPPFYVNVSLPLVLKMHSAEMQRRLRPDNQLRCTTKACEEKQVTPLATTNVAWKKACVYKGQSSILPPVRLLLATSELSAHRL